MIAQTHTFPSLSGTFGIPARLALNPKMPKEPSSPSRSDTRIERQCIKNETNRQRNNFNLQNIDRESINKLINILKTNT